MSFGAPMHIFLLPIYLGVKLLTQRINEKPLIIVDFKFFLKGENGMKKKSVTLLQFATTSAFQKKR